MADNLTVFTATVLDQEATLTVTELCQSLGLELDELSVFVQEGLVEPHGGSPESWRFPGSAFKRLRTATRLRRDLGIDLAGAILAVDLLEEIERLRTHVRALERLLGETR
ncbi:MAG: chaperone modulator CbpM [Acidiferrobacterales bacterium]